MSDLMSEITPVLRVVVITACVVGLFLGINCFGSTNRRNAVAVTKEHSENRAAIPAIDGSAPERTETATFALG